MGEHRVTDGELTSSLHPLGDVWLASVFVISRNFGKRLKNPPSCCAGALWDMLGLLGPAVLGFVRLCRSTKLFFYLILFLSLTLKYFPVLPRVAEPIERLRDRISRQLKSLPLLNVTKPQSHLSASKLDRFCGVHKSAICFLLMHWLCYYCSS